MAVTAAEILEVVDSLTDAGINVSVAGGWAVDALLGRLTREHGDLDLAIDVADVARAIDVLHRAGFDLAVDERPARIELRNAECVVDLHPVTISEGIGRQTGLRGEVYEYPPGSMDAVGTIEGRAVRCLAPDLLARFHGGYEPRLIDRADMAALAQHFGIDLPAEYRGGPTA